MAIDNVIVNVLDVGQGQCTFVELYDDSTPAKLIHALLFDCGSDKKSNETYINLDYIVTKIQELDEPGFDCIFFSHSDKDHISLTRYVVDNLAKKIAPKVPKVKEVWYGGAHEKYTKSGFNILDHLVDEKFCTNDDLKSTSNDYSGYDRTTEWFDEYLWKSGDSSVFVSAIVSNVISDDPDFDDEDFSPLIARTAEELNRVSMVCYLYFGGSSYVICGDATNKTMAAINTRFAGAEGDTFDDNNMLTLPHHGSRATGLAVKSSADASDGAIEVVDTFAALVQAQTTTVSAYEKHRHPSLELMNHFIPTITTPILRDTRLKMKNAHRATAYIDIKLVQPKGWSLVRTAYSFDTQTNVFTTRYSKPMTWFSYNLGDKYVLKKEYFPFGQQEALDEFACWQYETDTNGDFTLAGYANMSSGIFTSPSEDELTAMDADFQLPERKIPLPRKPITTSNQILNRLKHFH